MKPKDITIKFEEGDQVGASVEALIECIELQKLKGRDYQAAGSTVSQADYYPSGVKTIHEIMHAKMTRMKSLISTVERNGPDAKPNFETLEDSLKDLINYASFGIAYCRGKIQGQNQDNDILNRLKAPAVIAETAIIWK